MKDGCKLSQLMLDLAKRGVEIVIEEDEMVAIECAVREQASLK